jgi:hypothetical protein
VLDPILRGVEERLEELEPLEHHVDLQRAELGRGAWFVRKRRDKEGDEDVNDPSPDCGHEDEPSRRRERDGKHGELQSQQGIARRINGNRLLAHLGPERRIVSAPEAVTTP